MTGLTISEPLYVNSSGIPSDESGFVIDCRAYRDEV